MNREDQLLAMLAAALTMEIKGKKFYDRAAARSTNELGKKTFTMLALDELVHMERIRKIYSLLESEDRWPENWRKLSLRHQNLLPVFRTLIKKYGPQLVAKSSDLKALDVGLEFEAGSIKFYQGYLKKAGGRKEKEFISRMVAEEKGHYAALSDMRFYLSDPAGWFREKEKTSLDGA